MEVGSIDIVGISVFYNGEIGKTKSITFIEVYKRIMECSGCNHKPILKANVLQ